MSMVDVEELTVRYGSLTAVDNVSLRIAPGEIFGLVGPNGAGKTTTLRVLCGLLPPDAGRVRVFGYDVVSERDAVRCCVGYMADFFGVYDHLTVEEYLSFFGGMYGKSDWRMQKRVVKMLEAVNLMSKRGAYVRTLSRGMKQRLYCARALIHEPQLLVLDEPASGLDPRGRAELMDTLGAVHAQGATIVISSHILSELQGLITSVGIMETGRLVAVRRLGPAGGETAKRRVVLHVVPADTARALALLETLPDVLIVDRRQGGLVLDVEDSDAAAAEVLRRALEQGIRVLPPRADGEDLKHIFLKLTRGELM